jgi:uroporphyrinogen-III decarboxylase
MRIAGALLTFLTLGSCGSASDDAKRELEIVTESGGNLAERCRAERKVADAYLAEHKQAEYDAAKLTADITCRRASQEGLL